MPRGGDRVGALVIADLIGEQDLAALRDLDMALGDREAELVVVLDLVVEYVALAVRLVIPESRWLKDTPPPAWVVS